MRCLPCSTIPTQAQPTPAPGPPGVDPRHHPMGEISIVLLAAVTEAVFGHLFAGGRAHRTEMARPQPGAPGLSNGAWPRAYAAFDRQHHRWTERPLRPDIVGRRERCRTGTEPPALTRWQAPTLAVDGCGVGGITFGSLKSVGFAAQIEPDSEEGFLAALEKGPARTGNKKKDPRLPRHLCGWPLTWRICGVCCKKRWPWPTACGPTAR